MEQVAACLRDGLQAGHWQGSLPGVDRLAPELGVSRKTLEAALLLLEAEGLLQRQGPRRKRTIQQQPTPARSPLRVGLMLYEPEDRHLQYMVELQHALTAAGHVVVIAPRALTELKMDVARVQRVVSGTAAEAWIVLAGPRDVVEWFAASEAPAFALFGRQEGLRIAGTRPDKVPAFAAATRHLVGLGHSRIVLIARRGRRLPVVGRSERAFLNELRAHGIPPGDFNLPDWEESREGLQALLRSLFQVTPPTAFIVEEATVFVAVQQFVAAQGLKVPQQVSLICTDADPAFAWCQPAISHIRWEPGPLVRRMVRWASSVAKGQPDLKQTTSPAEFIVGGTTGPVAGAGGGSLEKRS